MNAHFLPAPDGFFRLEVGRLESPIGLPTVDEPQVEELEVAEPVITEPEVDESPVEQRTPPGGSGSGFRVILYDDDYHGQDEVVEQLQKATEYSALKCWTIMMEADQKGRAICFHGSRDKCQRVAKVLREIRLQCEVDCDD